MPLPPPHRPSANHPRLGWLWGILSAAAAALLAACGSTPSPTPSAPSSERPAASQATSALAYRQDAARHLYRLNAARIYPGVMPPMLQAVGVLEVHLDRQGQVRNLHWLRAPRHVPQVMQEIERTVRAAAPYPAAQRLGYVTYTDTWLWHESGQFQLDTLTEGQR